MNILVTINKGYVEQFRVLLRSIVKSNPKEKFIVYVFYKDLDDYDIEKINSGLSKCIQLRFIKIENDEINSFPVYEKRYPVEVYFRLFASLYLPNNVDRVLYLDIDIVVINSLKKLYEMDFLGNYYIASSNVNEILRKFNEIRLGMMENAPYINSGVMLINVKELRKINVLEDVRNFLDKRKNVLMLPDQDIISGLYGDKIKLIDEMKFNLSDRSLSLYNFFKFDDKIDLDWIKKNVVIIHYYGRNKPWKKGYRGVLNCFYEEVLKECMMDEKV